MLLNGRVQPFDSVARNALLQIRSTGDVPLEEVPSWKFWHHAKKLKSTEWLLEVAARPEVADTRPIFLIHHSELLGELKLQDKGVEKSGLRYYTFDELKPLPDRNQRARPARPARSRRRSRRRSRSRFSSWPTRVMLYQRLKVTLQPEGAEDFAQELADFQKDLGPARRRRRPARAARTLTRQALQRIAPAAAAVSMMARYRLPAVVPPLDPAEARDNWQTVGASLLESGPQRPDSSRRDQLRRDGHGLSPAASREAFNRAVAELPAWLAPQICARKCGKGRAEFYFNDMKPFLHAMIIYIFAFVLACGALLTFALAPNLSESLRRSAFYLIMLAWLVHTFGLIFRMALEGRPPVTNLYSSAIFIGWGAMVLGLVLERIYRVGLGSVVAVAGGFRHADSSPTTSRWAATRWR